MLKIWVLLSYILLVKVTIMNIAWTWLFYYILIFGIRFCFFNWCFFRIHISLFLRFLFYWLLWWLTHLSKICWLYLLCNSSNRDLLIQCHYLCLHLWHHLHDLHIKCLLIDSLSLLLLLHHLHSLLRWITWSLISWGRCILLCSRLFLCWGSLWFRFCLRSVLFDGQRLNLRYLLNLFCLLQIGILILILNLVLHLHLDLHRMHLAHLC